MNTFTFSGKIDSDIKVKMNAGVNKEYADFTLFVDDRCSIGCRSYGEPGSTLFFHGYKGDRIEGVARLCSTPIKTWLEILNVNFVDKKIEAKKPSEKIIEAFKVHVKFDIVLDCIYNYVKPSFKKEEIKNFMQSVVLAIVSTDDVAAMENAKSINETNFQHFCGQFFVGDMNNGFTMRKVFDLQKYVNKWMKNVKSLYFSDLF